MTGIMILAQREVETDFEQAAGGVGAGVLGEMDEIDRRAALLVELGDFFLELEREWVQQLHACVFKISHIPCHHD
jgi:hypothetical protein